MKRKIDKWHRSMIHGMRMDRRVQSIRYNENGVIVYVIYGI